MKKRSSDISKHLRIGIFLVSFLLVLWNCEKEPLLETQNNFISKVKSKVNTDLIDLPYTKDNLTVDWNNYNIVKSNDIEFYEFKTALIAPLNNTSENFGSPIFYVVAYKENNTVVIKYIEVRAYDYSLTKFPEDFINLGAFSGSFRYFNEKGKLENSEAFIEGYLIKASQENYLPVKRNTLQKAKEEGSFQARVQPCTEVPSILYIHETTHHYKDYYKASYRVDSSGNVIEGSVMVADVPYKSIYLGSTTQTYTYTSFSCDTPDTGDAVYKSEYMRQQILMDCGPGYDDVTYDGECVPIDDAIIDNTNNPCVSAIIKALQEKDMKGALVPDLEGMGHLSQMVLDLFDHSQTYNLTFNIGQLNNIGSGVSGNTNGFDITLDTDLVKDATKLFIAKTVIHESFHAYIHYVVRENPGSIMTTVLKKYQNFYTKSNPTNAGNLTEHKFISQYVEALAYSLSSYDNHQQPMDYYKALSWAGLESSSAYQSLSNSDKTKIQNIIKNERLANSNAKSTKC
ncbi:hypothetical protein [Tenacibaculum sp.]|uniref:hypothetical protein n=1 Tax=Tenacibaculum sp. TaxID=1906242 RepID=UPI003AA83BF6